MLCLEMPKFDFDIQGETSQRWLGSRWMPRGEDWAVELNLSVISVQTPLKPGHFPESLLFSEISLPLTELTFP